MIYTSRSWHRSPVLWFFLPGLVFVLWAWIHSMSWYSTVDFGVGRHSVELHNGRASAGVSWNEMSPSRSRSKVPAFESRAHRVSGSRDWFPLPSYIESRIGPAWHHLSIPHWFLLLVMLGLWQLPWLGRYFRRKRIAAAHSP